MAKKEKRARKPKDPGASWNLARAVRAVSTAATALIVMGLLIGLAVGRSALQARAAELKREPIRVAFAWPPLLNKPGEGRSEGTWLDPETRKQLEAIATATLSSDPFDARNLKDTQRALMSTGWFAAPCTVRRDSAGIVRIDGRWRIPFAVVRSANLDRLVTYNGELLDKAYRPDASNLYVIFGPSQDAPSAAGQVWAGSDVQAGLALLAYLRATPGFDQIKGIDVSGYAKKTRRQLVIVAQSGGRVLWGGPPELFIPGEAPAAAKLRRLADLVARTGKIDGGSTFIDISLDGFAANTATQSSK